MKQYNFLNDNYADDFIVVESTDYYRTIQSAYSEMWGMYP